MTRTTRFALPAILLLASVALSGCFRRTFVIVPHRDGGYGARDTLYGQRAGETVRVVSRDTLRVVVRDTVLVGGGRRLVFVPPGLFPPAGQCRVWIHDRPPGQQARSQPCALLGPVPAGAFVLFDGVAWDVDHDWVAESRRASVPPEILALRRAGAP